MKYNGCYNFTPTCVKLCGLNGVLVPGARRWPRRPSGTPSARTGTSPHHVRAAWGGNAWGTGADEYGTDRNLSHKLESNRKKADPTR